MNREQFTQIIETIRTLNLNIDSQSMIEITETIMPLLWFVFIKDLMINIIGFACFVIAIWIISKAVMSYYKKRSEN